MVIEIKNSSRFDSNDLSFFILNAGNSLDSFRYFKSRELSCIKNHLTTILLYEKNSPVGYGHLDNDNGVIWLGICISEVNKGKGLGKLIMANLLEFAKKNSLPSVQLTVDKSNVVAISLYEKFGFKIISEIKNEVLLMINNMDLI